MPPIPPSIVDVMEFLVLGPLRVSDDGSHLDLGGPKQRTLLALLVASAGRPVPTDALLMGVYGPDADPRARRSIQTWISAFRRNLGPIIERHGDGYTLEVDSATIDACRFEERIGSSRKVRNDEVALGLLTEALDMWRGRPYEDVEPADVLQAESRRLESLWSEALDARIRLDLDRGRHRQLVAELETLVADHPHHENLRAHQMVALYRCGRQADALRAYRTAEQRLRDDLGVDPSPELRELEHRILVQDRSLEYRPRARLRAIPARYTSFVGRGADVGGLADLIRSRRLVTVTGAGGVGKSSLAVEAVRSLADEYPSAYVPIEANREADPWQLIASAIGMTVGDVEAAAVVEAIGQGSLVLVLDGCEHLLDTLTGTVTELLTACPNLRVVLTSREALGVTGEYVFGLDPLDHGEGSAANQLFADRAGIDLTRLGDDEIADVTLIGQRLSGLPLGLELAAARSRTMSLSEISGRLDDQVDLLRSRRGAEPRRRSISDAIGWSYDLLDEDARTVFRRLGAFPTGTIRSDAVAAVLGTDDPRGALEPLLDASLIGRADSGDAVYSVLEPIRQYAARLLEEHGEAADARLRYAQWIVAVCAQMNVDRLAGDRAKVAEAMRLHGPSIAATARWAVDAGHPDITLAIIAGCGRAWPNFADPRMLTVPGMAALDRAVLDRSDPADAALRLRSLAHLAFLHTPEHPETARSLLATLIEEYDAEAELDPLTSQIVASIRAIVPYRAGPDRRLPRDFVAEGRAQLDRSIDLAVSMGYPAEPHLYNRAIFSEDAGDYVGALADLRRLRDWAGEDQPLWSGMALQVIAKHQALAGHHEAGIESAAEAARLLIEGGDLDFAAEAEFMVAAINVDLERFADAQASIERADEYREQVGLRPVAIEDPELDARIAAGLGDWKRYAADAARFLARVPEDEEERGILTVGTGGITSSLAGMIEPTVRFLAAHGRSAEASRLAGAMPLLAEHSPTPEVYATCGILETTARLAVTLELPDPLLEFDAPSEVLEAMTEYLLEALEPYRTALGSELARDAGLGDTATTA